MKKVLLSLGAALFLAAGAQAQVSYGLKAGVNLGKFSNVSDAAKDYQVMNPSFYVTGFADLPVASNFSIQPGVSLQGKGSKFNYDGDGLDGKSTTNVMSVEIPVNAVYYIPAGAGNVYLGLGPYIGFNVSGKTKTSGSIGDWGVEGENDIKFSGDNKNMNLIDAGANFMAGYKFNNGLLINAGYGLGLTNLNPSDNSDNNYSSRTLNFGIGFQF
ncbi:porin family protein [Sphingobacterium hungaricum]